MCAVPRTTSADDLSASVTDQAGNTVSLTSVGNATLAFSVASATRQIPPVQIRRIDATEKEILKVTLVSGEAFDATSSDTITGKWDLGTYSLPLAKVKSVVFAAAHVAGPPWSPPPGYVGEIEGTLVYGLSYDFEFVGRDSNWIPPKSYVDRRKYSRLPVFVGDQVTVFIPFENIKSLTSDEVTLVDGTKVSGALTSKDDDDSKFLGRDRKLVGVTPYGTITFPIAAVSKLTFLHDKDRDTDKARPYWDRAFGIESKLSASVTTASDRIVDFKQIGVYEVAESGYYNWKEISTLGVYLGDSLNAITISNLKGIYEFRIEPAKYRWENKLLAKLATKSGNSLSVRMEKADIYFGGLIKEGFALVRADRLKSIDFR
jgi:hypothetical protein